MLTFHRATYEMLAQKRSISIEIQKGCWYR